MRFLITGRRGRCTTIMFEGLPSCCQWGDFGCMWVVLCACFNTINQTLSTGTELEPCFHTFWVKPLRCMRCILTHRPTCVLVTLCPSGCSLNSHVHQGVDHLRLTLLIQPWYMRLYKTQEAVQFSECERPLELKGKWWKIGKYHNI